MKEQKKQDAVDESMTLEEAFRQLDGVVERLESREITLEESFKVYQSGMNLLKTCNDKIDRVEKKMLLMDEDGGLREF
ncbi:MAG: exodeoxyribonuclease VII small subunit [Lachnospiraceae bacterium]|nr:exodeoxyribonuclease VII small subunit [Lachnospiraceae bacterium]MCI9545217.1 exodeoxyribonuclease VII small subunit [Lachnospiraceae bacterium]